MLTVTDRNLYFADCTGNTFLEKRNFYQFILINKKSSLLGLQTYMKMYDICHPVYYELCKLGCSDPVKISIAFYVYIELCEVKRFHEVNYKYNKELDLFYFEVRKNQDSPLEIFISWSTRDNISFSKIEKMQDILQSPGLIFFFKNEDSSSICYRVNRGLIKPASPETTRQRKEKEEKKFNLEAEIRKNTLHLYELAKTLNECSNQSCDANLDISESIKPANIDSSVNLANIDSSVNLTNTDSSVNLANTDSSVNLANTDITTECKSTDS